MSALRYVSTSARRTKADEAFYKPDEAVLKREIAGSALSLNRVRQVTGRRQDEAPYSSARQKRVAEMGGGVEWSVEYTR